MMLQIAGFVAAAGHFEGFWHRLPFVFSLSRLGGFGKYN
jgi:hypothetical protein